MDPRITLDPSSLTVTSFEPVTAPPDGDAPQGEPYSVYAVFCMGGGGTRGYTYYCFTGLEGVMNLRRTA